LFFLQLFFNASSVLLADVLAKPLFGLLAVAIMILKTKAEEGEKELL
jgi:hypothetical protein